MKQPARIACILFASTVVAISCFRAPNLAWSQARSQAIQDATSAASKDTAKSEEGLTLKTERQLKFTTDEGTWISLDVSPDGQEIVFDLLGHIYMMPIAGGNAK